MQHDLQPLAEAQRQFLICSSCRYCEGYCATFPAIEGRTSFTAADVDYIANLCHDCRACHQACMYTPPHEFAVDIPTLLSKARLQTYRERTIPEAAKSLYGGANGVLAFLIALAALAALFAAIAVTGRWDLLSQADDAPGAFYKIVPFLWMLVPALVLSAWAVFVFFAGARRLVVDVAPDARATLGDWLGALKDGVELIYMKGGGGGCYYPEAGSPSNTRRVLHLVLVVGVILAFAATIVAAIMQDLFEQLPPYPVFSGPVLLGIAGGVLILIGSLGLLALKAKPGATALEDKSMVRLDEIFLWLLAIVGATGLLLLVSRATAFMGPLLVIHLAAIAALFVTAPYGKFMHVPLRVASLLVFRLEEAARK